MFSSLRLVDMFSFVYFYTSAIIKLFCLLGEKERLFVNVSDATISKGKFYYATSNF